MSEARIDEAIGRIENALRRMDAARTANPPAPAPDDTPSEAAAADEAANSARVMTLVNNHEKLREEVADTLRELDGVIAELEE